MRYRSFFIGAATALLTFILLQATVGQRYWRPYGWGWSHYRYGPYDRPPGYDNWHDRNRGYWWDYEKHQQELRTKPADSTAADY